MNYKFAKRPDKVKFSGRILFLTEDPNLIRKQLAGEDLEWTPQIKLRDQISTDEITPAYVCYYFDETLGDFPYVGLKAGDEFPITRGAVRQGGFAVSVSGKRRGKGSSREQSPFAEMCAGIQLVIAESIERIYNQNCQNLGILTSTNFELIPRIRAGEEIPLSEFTDGADEITRKIIEYGGLFNFNMARLSGEIKLPVPTTARRPMTIAEKIFARHFVVDLASNKVGVEAVRPGDAGFVMTDIRFSHEYVTPMAAIFFEKYLGKDAKVRDSKSIYFFRDHLTFLDEVITPERRAAGLLGVAEQLKLKQEEFALRQGIRLHGELADRKGSEAICHSKILQSYALPGQLIIGSDSHTPHSGAIGCVAFGVGTTDIFNSWITKDVRITVPQSVRICIRGRKPYNVTAKDFMLAILRDPYVKNGEAIGKIVEYCGEAVESLGIDERATLTNMAAEVGAFTGIVAPDEKTVEYLMRTRGLAAAEAYSYCEGLFSDPDAEYVHTIEIDASRMRPMVALPGDPGNGIFIDELDRKVKIDIAYGGSCTGGKAEDMDMYAEVFLHALKEGRGVHPEVRCFIQFGSQEVRDYCIQKGYLEVFRKAGVQIIEPSCGACINAGPGVSTLKKQVTVSAINRNFPGRSGPGDVYLASPYTVAASAIAGHIVEYQN
ncbi:MAG: aconitase family protein [Acidobacteriota bacterium]|nr:aconitase family protein [Blastocatellia bacterium]MDW8413370.1 aconitase family protein [Acidobacteriota bacterium]